MPRQNSTEPEGTEVEGTEVEGTKRPRRSPAEKAADEVDKAAKRLEKAERRVETLRASLETAKKDAGHARRELEFRSSHPDLQADEPQEITYRMAARSATVRAEARA